LKPVLGNASKYRTAAVLAAAGSGSRYTDGSVPKQFVDLAGKPLYRWSLERLCFSDCIDLIVITALNEAVEDIQSQVQDLSQSKPIHVIAGGATRQLSVYRGLEYLESIMKPLDDRVLTLVHDAARPFLSRSLIDSVLMAAKEHGAATVALPVSDTVKLICDMVIEETLDRKHLALVQTPQAARLNRLIEAHRSAIIHGISTTDDAAILEKFGIKVHVVSGSPFNIKITSPADMELASLLAQSPLSAFE
jgi:2-C-methyl-D-erythritol 4-phosphate cytidylyltransferase